MMRVSWIAGPIRYWQAEYGNYNLAWEFVGEVDHQRLARWQLRYSAQSRKFWVKDLQADTGDQAHVTRIRDIYRAIAVNGRDLPRGTLSEVLRAMLPAKEISFATRMSI